MGQSRSSLAQWFWPRVSRGSLGCKDPLADSLVLLMAGLSSLLDGLHTAEPPSSVWSKLDRKAWEAFFHILIAEAPSLVMETDHSKVREESPRGMGTPGCRVFEQCLTGCNYCSGTYCETRRSWRTHGYGSEGRKTSLSQKKGEGMGEQDPGTSVLPRREWNEIPERVESTGNITAGGKLKFQNPKLYLI